MTGEELLSYVRSRVADHGIASYFELNRALRDYCETAGFDWLREVHAAALLFEADKDEYPLAELGLRRIDRVWVKDDESGEWKPLDERRGLSFERSVREYTDKDGDVNTENDPPGWFEIYGSGVQVLRIGPKPGQTWEGRIDGIASTPQIERLKELPGPDEYHHLVGDIAAGYTLEHLGLTRLQAAEGQESMAIANTLMSRGRDMAALALQKMPRVVRDSAPNRLASLKPAKQPLMR